MVGSSFILSYFYIERNLYTSDRKLHGMKMSLMREVHFVLLKKGDTFQKKRKRDSGLRS